MDDLRPDHDHSPLRKALMWAFDWPATPYVDVSVSVDVLAAKQYLAQLNADGTRTRVTLQHLLAASIARCLTAFPEANARVVSGRVRRFDEVSLIMAINLLGHSGGKERELALGLVRDVGSKTLRELADAATKQVDEERTGKATNPLVSTVFKLARFTPKPLMDAGLDTLFRGVRSRLLSSTIDDTLPASTFLTNPGAVIRPAPGSWVRSGGLHIPAKLAVVGTFWGVSTIQDEVVPVDGVPTVRPCLPVFYFFDHRVLDGVLGGSVLRYFCEVLADPAAHFGEDGDLRP